MLKELHVIRLLLGVKLSAGQLKWEDLYSPLKQPLPILQHHTFLELALFSRVKGQGTYHSGVSNNWED